MKILATLLFAGKLGKFLTTGGTMLISVFAYAFIFGWAYAAGFVGLIFVHEMGHYIAAKKCGMNVGAPTFIPFMGAWIELKDQPMNAETEAFIGIAGPMLGSLAAFILYMLSKSTGSQMLLALAYSGFFLNLFNLIPLSPLDGGRIVAIISPKMWLVGVPLLAGLFFWRPSPLLILIAVLAAPQVFSVIKGNAQENSRYYATPKSIRMQYAIYYLVLAIFLAILSFDIHEMLPASI